MIYHALSKISLIFLFSSSSFPFLNISISLAISFSIFVFFLLSHSFDFKLLAQKSLATGVWKEQNPATLDTFANEFQRMVRNSTAKKLEMYRADSTIYEEPKLKGTDEARVTAHLWYKGKESVLEYRMNLINGSWKAWDLIIDDLSTARN